MVPFSPSSSCFSTPPISTMHRLSGWAGRACMLSGCRQSWWWQQGTGRSELFQHTVSTLSRTFSGWRNDWYKQDERFQASTSCFAALLRPVFQPPTTSITSQTILIHKKTNMGLAGSTPPGLPCSSHSERHAEKYTNSQLSCGLLMRDLHFHLRRDVWKCK